MMRQCVAFSLSPTPQSHISHSKLLKHHQSLLRATQGTIIIHRNVSRQGNSATWKSCAIVYKVVQRKVVRHKVVQHKVLQWKAVQRKVLQ